MTRPSQFELLEPRLLLSVVIGEGQEPFHRFTDPATGAAVTVVHRGPGNTELFFANEDNTGSLVTAVLHNTTLTSVLSIQATQAITMQNIVVTSSANQIVAPQVNVDGNILVTGLLRHAHIRNMASPAQQILLIQGVEGDQAIEAPPGFATTLIMNQVQDLTLSSAAGLQQLRVAQWLDQDPLANGEITPIADAVTAPWVNQLLVLGGVGVTGDFQADLNLSGLGSPFRAALNVARINGSLSEATWTFDGDVNGDGTVNVVPDVGTVIVMGQTRNVAIDIGQAPPETPVRRQAYLRLGDVAETTIDSATGISTLYVTRWLAADPDTGTDQVADTVTAPWITQLLAVGAGPAMPGDFQAGLVLSGLGSPFRAALNNAVIRGSLTDATWRFDGDVTGNGTADAIPDIGVITVLGQTRRVVLDVGQAPVEPIARRRMVLRLGDVADTVIASQQGIASLVVSRWLEAAPEDIENPDAQDDRVIAPWIGALHVLGARNVAGDFEADLILTGLSSPFRAALNSAVIRGSLANADWTLVSPMTNGVPAGTPDLGVVRVLGQTRNMNLTVGPAPEGVVRRRSVLHLGEVVDSRIESEQGIGSLVVSRWVRTGNAENDVIASAVVAPFVGTLLATGAREMAGDFQADLELSGLASPWRTALNSAVIRGSLVDATWTLAPMMVNGTPASAPDLGAVTVLGQTRGLDLQIGQAPEGTIRRRSVLRLGDVSNTTIDSGAPIHVLQVARWQENDPITGANTTDDSVSAPWINVLQALGGRGLPGHWQADLTLTGEGAPLGRVLTNALVRNNLTEAQWDLQGNVGLINVMGMIDEADINVAGNATQVRFGRLGAEGHVNVDGNALVLTSQLLGTNGPALGWRSGTVNIGGNGLVRTGRVYRHLPPPAEPGTYNTLYAPAIQDVPPDLDITGLSFQQLLGYDMLGTTWTYNLTRPDTQVIDSLAVSVAPTLQQVTFNGTDYQVARVTEAYSDEQFVTEWLTDQSATRLVSVRTIEGADTDLLAYLVALPVAPATLEVAQPYNFQGPLAGVWNLQVTEGDPTPLDITNGSVSISTTLPGFDWADAPLGRYYTVQYEMQVVLSGTLVGEIMVDGTPTPITRTFQVVQEENGYTVPGIGIVQATTTRTVTIAGLPQTVDTFTRHLADVVGP